MVRNWQTEIVGQLGTAQRKLGIIPAAFIPNDGALGTVLTKLSATDYDCTWAAVPAGLILAGNGLLFAGATIHFAQAGAYTSGAVAFATGAATMGFDAANLFWDDTLNYLGIGIAVPTYPLHISYNWAGVGNYIGVNAYVFNTASANTAGYQLGGSFVVETLGVNNYTLPVDAVIGVDGQARHNGLGTCAALTGSRGYALKLNTGPVTSLYGGRFQVFNQNAVGAVTNGIGVFIDTPVITGTITNYYAAYLATGAGTNLSSRGSKF
jgi:hypothetical protein